jgi:hypothetical protein
MQFSTRNTWIWLHFTAHWWTWANQWTLSLVPSLYSGNDNSYIGSNDVCDKPLFLIRTPLLLTNWEFSYQLSIIRPLPPGFFVICFLHFVVIPSFQPTVLMVQQRYPAYSCLSISDYLPFDHLILITWNVLQSPFHLSRSYFSFLGPG